MKEQIKQQVRVCLSPEAIEKASDFSNSTGLNLSEAVEAYISHGHLPLTKAYGAKEYGKTNKK